MTRTLHRSRPNRASISAITSSIVASVLASGGALAQSTTPAIFVTNNVGDSVTSFTVNPNGSLTRVAAFPSGDGPQTTSLSPNGRFLAVANGTASTTVEELRIFEVNSDATLTLRLTTTVPDSPLDVQWVSNAAIAVAQTGAGNTRTYEYDSGANSFTQLDFEDTGSFTSRLATTRGGSILYANNTSGGNSISAFSVAPNGTLNLIEVEPTTGFAVDIAATHDGRFLYGAGGISGDGNRILGYSIEPSGALTPLAPVTYTSPGESPKVIAFTEDDSTLIAGHGTDATVQTFKIDPLSGDLTTTGFSFDVGLQGTLGDLQTLGNLLFVTDSSTATDGITGVYSFTILPDGSLSPNGPILDTLGARPEYIATWGGIPEPTSAASVTLLIVAALCKRGRRCSK